MCLILRASYTCSLISHLIVQGKSVAINNLEELVELQKSNGWEWGTRTFDGAFNSLLTISTNPDYHTAKAHMQVRKNTNAIIVQEYYELKKIALASLRSIQNVKHHDINIITISFFRRWKQISALTEYWIVVFRIYGIIT